MVRTALKEVHRNPIPYFRIALNPSPKSLCRIASASFFEANGPTWMCIRLSCPPPRTTASYPFCRNAVSNKSASSRCETAATCTITGIPTAAPTAAPAVAPTAFGAAGIGSPTTAPSAAVTAAFGATTGFFTTTSGAAPSPSAGAGTCAPDPLSSVTERPPPAELGKGVPIPLPDPLSKLPGEGFGAGLPLPAPKPVPLPNPDPDADTAVSTANGFGLDRRPTVYPNAKNTPHTAANAKKIPSTVPAPSEISRSRLGASCKSSRSLSYGVLILYPALSVPAA